MSKEKFGVGQSIKYAKRKPRKALLFVSILVLMSFAVNLLLLPYLEKYVSKNKSREIEKLKYEYALMNIRMERMNKEIEDLNQKDDSLYSGVFGLEPLSKEVRMAGTGGHDMNADLNGYEYSYLLKTTNTKLKALQAKIQIQQESYKRIDKKVKMVSTKISSIPAIQPIINKRLQTVSSGYGMRLHPIHDEVKMHWGMDFSAPRGTKICATGDGVVEFAGDRHDGYGKNVIINHGFGYTTLYGHMSKIAVKRGQKVKRKDYIGDVGNTGQSTDNHLHYEVMKKGEKIDPANFFFEDLNYTQYRQMMEISSRITRALD
ncbi:MAG: M23 family metallopeptidase [Bacteroidetes bacterium]|nr:M23 family metallopeptidase [Bacteroidota bacterium]